MNREGPNCVTYDDKYRISNFIQRSVAKQNPMNQDNRGKRWTSEEDKYLLQQIGFMQCSEIGRHLKRSENGVTSRLKKLAFHMIQSGEEPSVVQANLKLSDEDMEQINNEFFIYPRKAMGKFITTIKPLQPKKGYFQAVQSSPKQEIQLLLEIRGMLKKLLSQNNEYTTPVSYMSPNKEKLNNKQNTFRVFDINLDELEKTSEEFAKMN